MNAQRLTVVDGFRAIAIIAVVLFHVFPATVAGGFIGVDIFFAISGFVIALRYTDRLVGGEVTFASFYARRIRRLLPACLVLLVATTVLAYATMVPRDLENYGFTLAPQAVFMQNVAFWQLGDYFFFEPLLKPLLHTWSLAVEEQFYLLFPLLIIALRWRPRWSTALILAILLLSLALGFVGMRLSVQMTFYLLPFRAWEFMVGMLAAVLFKRWMARPVTQTIRHLASAALLLGVAAVIVAIAGFRQDASFPGPQSMLALGGTGLALIAQGHALPWLHRAFAHPLIQHFGRISYSWYLWHWPVVSFHYLYFWRSMTLTESVVALLIGYGLGAISYLTVERWGQRSIWLRKPANTIGLLLVFAVFSLTVGLAAMSTRGFVDRFQGREKALYVAQMSIPPYRCPITSRLRLDDGQFCKINATTSGEGVLLMGDSHADMMKPALATMATDARRPFFFLMQNCRISDYGNRGSCKPEDWAAVLRQIRENRITDVIVQSYFRKKFDAARFTQAVADLADQGVRVTISLPTPDSPELDPGFWIRAGKTDRWPQWLALTRSDVDAAYADLRMVMRNAAAQRPGIRLIDATAVLCPDRCRFAVGGKLLYQDKHHLTDFGAHYIAPLYRQAIAGEDPRPVDTPR